MPSGDLESWGLSWSISLPDDANGAFEHGQLTLENGKDLVFKQSTNGDQDVTSKKYLLNKENGSLSEEQPSCDSGAVDSVESHWILQPHLSSIEDGKATFRMNRGGNNVLGLNREGTQNYRAELKYWIQGIEYSKKEGTIEWLESSVAWKYPSNWRGKLRSIQSASSGALESVK